MNKQQVENIQKLNCEIQSFRECYKDSELWGDRDGPVPVEVLISFLIENPHFQDIANNIKKLNNL